MMEVSAVQYLMIEEGGTGVAVLPFLTDEDRRCIELGVCTVLRIGGRMVEHIGPDGRPYSEVPEAKLVDNEDVGPYHVVPTE